MGITIRGNGLKANAPRRMGKANFLNKKMERSVSEKSGFVSSRKGSIHMVLFKRISSERIPVIRNNREIVWHIEDDSNRTLEITLELASKSFAFVWMSWNEDSQDFDRVSVSYDEIKPMQRLLFG